MGKERVIFSNRFDRPTLEQIEEEMKKENYDDNENLMSAEEFLDFMKKNRRTIPNERRIANKDKFIWAVRELSETYEIDADLIEDDDGYTASLYMNYASYNGYIKKLRPGGKFCVSVFRQNQEYHIIDVHDWGLFPLAIAFPGGWDGMRAGTA